MREPRAGCRGTDHTGCADDAQLHSRWDLALGSGEERCRYRRRGRDPRGPWWRSRRFHDAAGRPGAAGSSPCVRGVPASAPPRWLRRRARWSGLGATRCGGRSLGGRVEQHHGRPDLSPRRLADPHRTLGRGGSLWSGCGRSRPTCAPTTNPRLAALNTLGLAGCDGRERERHGGPDDQLGHRVGLERP